MAFEHRITCLLLFGLLLLSSPLQSQLTDTLFTCNQVITDNGGVTGNYRSNTDQIITICPDSTSDGFTELYFYTLKLGIGDQLCIYNGPDTTSRVMACLTSRDTFPPYRFIASPGTRSNCLTLRFTSDFLDEGPGWEAQVSCRDTCQNILARIDSTAPISRGRFINVCPGERIFFFGSGNYPENGQVYAHSDINSTFRWDFGDGSFAYGRNVSHVFQNPGGYTVRLQIIDPFGCTNTNIAERIVRVSPSPVFTPRQRELPTVCLGDTISISSSVNGIKPSANLWVLPRSLQFESKIYQTVDRPIPDGDTMPLTSTLIIDDFGPGQRLNNLSDLAGIGVNLEHSRLQDLSVRLICPSGQEVILHNSQGFVTDPTFLGSPILGDEGRVLAGQGAEYSWSPESVNPNWLDYIDQFNPDTLPPGRYLSEGNLSALQGCPLNGPWRLVLQDSQTTANGYLFNWSLDFKPALFPKLESFQSPIIDQQWVFDPTMLFLAPDSLIAVPEDPGYTYYRLDVTDAFGCSYDTTLRIGIRPETDPRCLDCNTRYTPLPDTLLCEGDSLVLSVQSSVPYENRIKFISDPKYPLGFANHPPGNPYASQLLVQGVAQDTLTNPIAQIISICININTDWNEDLAIFVKAPDGKILELSTNNGGGFDNYFNTCFTPASGTSITLGAAPFNGFFAPEGNWSALRGSPVNGTWELLVSDAFDPSNFGEVVDWSITFRSLNETVYNWSPAEGLSCTDCAEPILKPSATTTYNLDLTDAYGCSWQDAFTVQVLDTLPTPQIICGPLSPGKMIFNWGSLGEGLQYQGLVVINQSDSVVVLPTRDTFLIVDSLVFNDEVRLELSIVPPDSLYPCKIGVGESSCIFENCFTFSQIEQITDISCFGDSTGSVSVQSLRGTRPLTYYLNEDVIGQADSMFTGLVAGAYSLTTEDATGCRDTVFFEIRQPDSIAANLTQLDTLTCFGDLTATIQAAPIGGTGELDLNWNMGVEADPTLLTGLGAGNYLLTITDDLGCQRIDSVQINQPDSLTIDFSVTPISCTGDTNGALVANVEGGNGGYQLEWNTGSMDTLIQDLPEGIYSLTVTDNAGCSVRDTFVLTEPSPLQLDSLLIRPVSCFGLQDGQAEVIISGGTQPYRYEWNDPLDQVTATATNLAVGPLALNVLDNQNCLLTETVIIPQPALLEIDFDIKNVSCREGSDAQGTAIVTGGIRPFTYSWDNGQSDSTASQLVAGDYRLTVTDKNGCQTSDLLSISEPSSFLEVSAVQEKRGCFAEQLNQARAIATGGGATSYSYLWSNGQTGRIAQNLDSISYSVTVTDANGCKQSTVIKLRDQPKMKPNMIINQPSCFGLSNGALGVNFIDGRPNADLTQFRFEWNSGQRGPTITNLRGDSTYTVTVTDPDGCQAVESRKVPQPQLITFQMEVEDADCFNASNGSVEVTNISADTRRFQFQWDDRAGGQTTARAENLAAGVYTVTISDEANCFTIGQATVGQPDQIDLQFSVQENICYGDQTGAAKVFISGGVPEFQYSWSNNFAGPEILEVAAGAYQVTVTDGNGCQEVGSVRIPQPPPLEAEVESLDVSCFGEQDGSIAIKTTGGEPPYRFSADRIEYSGSPILVGLGAGLYNISIRDANDCSLLVTSEVKEPPALRVAIGAESSRIFLGDSVQLKAEAVNNQGPVLFEWIEPFPGALPCMVCDSFFIAPENSLSVQLIGTDSAGCIASDATLVNVLKEQILAVPTGFTPNDDGENDRLLIHGQAGTLINIFRVFDRNGNLVHEILNKDINDTSIGWDGTLNGENMSSDVYIWMIEATFPQERTKVFRGKTNLLR